MAGTKVGKKADSTILVTGASGFLGQFIVRQLLEEGYKVRTLVRRAADRSFDWQDKVEMVDGDVLDVLCLEDAIQGVDGVVHAAAKVSFRKKDHEKIRAVNVAGTENVVNVCLDEGKPRLVHVSSIAAIGKPIDGRMATEDTPWQPGQSVSAYATSKRNAELQVYRGIAEGLHATIVNPGIILGITKDWARSSMNIFHQAAQGLKFYQEGTAAMVAAKDVARACSLLLETDVPAGERYLLVAKNMPTGDMLKAFAQSVGKPGPSINIPGWLALNAARIAEFLNPRSPLTPEAINSGLSQDVYEGGKITQLGFSYTPIDELIREIGEAYKEDN